MIIQEELAASYKLFGRDGAEVPERGFVVPKTGVEINPQCLRARTAVSLGERGCLSSRACHVTRLASSFRRVARECRTNSVIALSFYSSSIPLLIRIENSQAECPPL
jgi:hypothetical protein